MRAYLTSILRSAWTYKLRLLAIATIVFLGAGIFAGLLSVSPNMQTAGDRYFDENNIYDLHLRSAYGFSKDDVKAIRQTPGVTGTQTVNLFDTVATLGSRDYTIQLNSYDASATAAGQGSAGQGQAPTQTQAARQAPAPAPQQAQRGAMNQLTLTAGRWPKAADEAVLIRPALGTQNIKLGDQITLKSKSGDGTSDILKRTHYKLVGLANTPEYLFFFYGGTTKGSGTLDYELFVPQSNFKLGDTVTDVFVTVKGARALNTFHDDYNKQVLSTKTQLTTLAGQRQKLPWQDASDSIAKAEKTLADNRTKANKSFADAEVTLADSKKKLDSGQATLNAQQKQYQSGRKQLAAGKKQLEQQKKAGQAKIDAGRAEAAAQFAAAQKQLDQLKYLISVTPTSTPGYAALVAQYEQGSAMLAAQKQAAEAQFAAAQSQLDSGIAAGAAKLAASQRQLDAAPAQLAAAQRQIDRGRAQLSKGRETLAQNRVTADKKFADAQKKIDDARQKLVDLGTPQWYVLQRGDDYGFSAFQQDTEAMKNLATIFPALFILVAALVSLTTMTRMVDEDRLVIGTYLSLGYNKFTISAKYLSYAVVLGIIGSWGGALFGMWLYPTVIWNTYAHLFTLPKMVTGSYPGYAAFSMALLTLAIVAAASVSIIATLRESSAALLLPKAPHPGKRTFLEHVKPLWRRLPFMQKVTVRNIFLNTRRMLMTVIGVAGCTALLLIGFGLHGSISSTLDRQMTQIFRYNIGVGFTGKTPSQQLRTTMNDPTLFSHSVLGMREVATVAHLNADPHAKRATTSGVYLTSFENAQQGDQLVAFLDAHTGKPLTFTNNSVFINAKLAEIMDLKVGSKLSVQPMTEHSGSHTITINGIVQNYTSNYLYIGQSAFARDFGKAPAFNQILARTAQGSYNKDALKKRLDEISDVSAISFVDESIERIGQMTANLNSVMLILIVAAAALAFVVLYTLTDINIAERKRELATLKVLGFYPGEMNSYIFREVFGLVGLGTVLGLILGQTLFNIVLTSVEPDGFRFVRALSPTSYLLAAALTLVFAVFVNLAMIPKIQGVDMLESLKSVE